MTMAINMVNDKNIPTDTDAYYETVASQEEIYLEETEEELRAIWISYDTFQSRNSGSTSGKNRGERKLDSGKRSTSDPSNGPCIAESLDEQLDHRRRRSDYRRFGCPSAERRRGRGNAETDSNG